MENNKILNLGIIGAGIIVKEFLDNVSMLPNVRVSGIFSRTYANAQDISKKYSIESVYSSADDLLKSDIDAVYIATQNNTHFLYSQKALMANKHVLCKNPAGVNFTQLYELLNLAEERKLKFMEDIRFLYTPSFIELKNILATNVFGKIISIEGSLGTIGKGARHTKDLCRGAILDLGIYPITAIIDILGYPDEIKSLCVKNEEGVDATTSAIFSYKNGQIANIHASFKSSTRSELRINCEEGIITIPKQFIISDKIILEKLDGRKEEIELSNLGSGIIQEVDHFRLSDRNQLNNDLSAKVIRAIDTIREQLKIFFDCDENNKK